MLSAPGLEVHKMRKLAECCFDNPAHPGEDMKGYISAMIDKSGDDAGTAASLGTLIHASIEDYLKDGAYNDKEVVLSTVSLACYQRWFSQLLINGRAWVSCYSTLRKYWYLASMDLLELLTSFGQVKPTMVSWTGSLSELIKAKTLIPSIHTSCRLLHILQLIGLNPIA